MAILSPNQIELIYVDSNGNPQHFPSDVVDAESAPRMNAFVVFKDAQGVAHYSQLDTLLNAIVAAVNGGTGAIGQLRAQLPPALVNGALATAVQALPVDSYSLDAVTVSASGLNPVHTPTAQKAVRLHYISLSADSANSAAVLAIVKLGSRILYKMSLKPGAIYARNIGAGRRYTQGNANDVLTVTLDSASTVHVSIEYEEV